jgi:hypothetical protein
LFGVGGGVEEGGGLFRAEGRAGVVGDDAEAALCWGVEGVKLKEWGGSVGLCELELELESTRRLLWLLLLAAPPRPIGVRRLRCVV